MILCHRNNSMITTREQSAMLDEMGSMMQTQSRCVRMSIDPFRM